MADAKRTVALLDVDYTLLFAGDELNVNLINELREAGIRDLYLFTDMTFGQKSVIERDQLCKRLEKSGFRVHGVIASPDYAWHLSSSILQSFYDRFIKLNIDLNKQRNLDQLEVLYQEFPAVARLLKEGDEVGQQASGSSFAYSLGKVDNEVDIRKIKERSNHCKLILDLASAGFAHPKGVLFKQFIRHKPDWVGGVLVFDDNEKSLESVNQVAVDSNLKVPVKTVHVPDIKRKGYKGQVNDFLRANLTEKKPSWWRRVLTAIKNFFNPYRQVSNKAYTKDAEKQMASRRGSMGAINSRISVTESKVNRIDKERVRKIQLIVGKIKAGIESTENLDQGNVEKARKALERLDALRDKMEGRKLQLEARLNPSDAVKETLENIKVIIGNIDQVKEMFEAKMAASKVALPVGDEDFDRRPKV